MVHEHAYMSAEDALQHAAAFLTCAEPWTQHGVAGTSFFSSKDVVVAPSAVRERLEDSQPGLSETFPSSKRERLNLQPAPVQVYRSTSAGPRTGFVMSYEAPPGNDALDAAPMLLPSPPAFRNGRLCVTRTMRKAQRAAARWALAHPTTWGNAQLRAQRPVRCAFLQDTCYLSVDDNDESTCDES